MSDVTVTVSNDQTTVIIQEVPDPVVVESLQQGPEGIQGPKGDTTYVGNIDGGHANSIYGGIPIVDGGGA